MFSAREIIDIAIQIERNGEKIYREAMAAVRDESLAAALQWMADEEVRHAHWFAELKQELQADTGRNILVEEFGRELFDGILKNRSFSLEEVDFSKIEDLQTMMEIFVEFEKDSVLFYQVLEPFVQDDETRNQLDAIIAEERRHIEMLQDWLDGSRPAAVRG